MTLTTHAVIASAVARPFINTHPVLVFLAALASHYLADMIPHWDYRLKSMADKDDDWTGRKWPLRERVFWKDFLKIACDGVLGAALVFFIVWPQNTHQFWFAALSIIGGMLPDFLQGIYYTRKAKFLLPLQKLHDWMHTKIKLGRYPLIGISFQLIIFLIAAFTA